MTQEPPRSPDAAPGPSNAALGRLDAAVRDWAAGRRWWLRAPILAWLVWILAHSWGDPAHTTLFRGIDLVFHEMGHILWSPLGELMGIAGGTITQLLVPVAVGAILYRQRDWFGVAFAIGWAGINCFEVAVYAGDAIARRLPLVSPTTGDPVHDWSYILTALNALQHTQTVAAAWEWAGRILMTAGVVFGGRVLWLMGTAPAGAGPDPELAAEAVRLEEHLRNR